MTFGNVSCDAKYFLFDLSVDGMGIESILSKTSSDVFNGKIFQL